MFAVLLVNLAVVLSPFFLHDFADAGMNKGLFFALAIMAIVYLFIFSSSLHTRIDAGGIKTWFTPFNLFRKDLKWSEIDGIYLRKYNALTEYGGIGVRGLGKSQSYNIGGNTGIQIEYTQSKKITDRHPQAFRSAECSQLLSKQNQATCSLKNFFSS